MASWQQTLAGLARDQGGSLKRQAFLLCGDDGQAEDLLQDALVRAFARPLRAPRPGAAEAYVRVILVNLFIDSARRRSRWRRAAPLLGGAEVAPDPADQVLTREVMLAALDDLSPRQRACVVLRYYPGPARGAGRGGAGRRRGNGQAVSERGDDPAGRAPVSRRERVAGKGRGR